jgi:hypothetical protein
MLAIDNATESWFAEKRKWQIGALARGRVRSLSPVRAFSHVLILASKSVATAEAKAVVPKEMSDASSGDQYAGRVLEGNLVYNRFACLLL